MSQAESEQARSYRASGVDIDAGNRLVDQLKPVAASTHGSAVLGGLGGFGGLFRFPVERYHEPVLVASTDGVGTKLLLAQNLGLHEGIGIDLVAMCANDIVVQGATPLFFLDYYACGQLEVGVAREVIEGIAAGCQQADMALLGGETAEMPGLYPSGDYELAGFCVGVAERTRLLDGSAVQAGDHVIGLASTGPHANGYSLIRRVLADLDADLDELLGTETLAEVLLKPTQIYVQPLLALLEKLEVHAMAHITGGGLVENVPRVLPAGTGAVIERRAWPRPLVFDWLQARGEIPETEMQRVFNCGIGMVVVVSPADKAAALAHFAALDMAAWDIGRIEARDGAPSLEFV